MNNFSITSNINEVLGFTARIHPQYRFGVALTLTWLAKQARSDVGPVLNSSIDRPTPFTRNGFFILPASKSNLQAVIGVKDKQAESLRYQIRGGTRSPKKVALRLPAVAQLNEYGNLPAGLIRQLIARAKAGKRVTKRQGQRFGVSQELDLFYGDPKDGRPAGIYKRVVVSPTVHKLVPVVVFPKRAARYKARFDFFGTVDRSVRANAKPQLRAAWARAIATSR